MLRLSVQRTLCFRATTDRVFGAASTFALRLTASHRTEFVPVSDLDIHRSVHLWIQTHGENATAKAREMVETMRKKGDNDGADVWLIIAAIGTLREPPTQTRR